VSRQSAHRWPPGIGPTAVGNKYIHIKLSALSTGRALHPRNIIFSVSSTHFCYKFTKPQGLVCLLLLIQVQISALRPGIINYGASCFSGGNAEESRQVTAVSVHTLSPMRH
jgi:hypothetical protein